MVCSRCQKLQKKTELATPGVKRKSDIYYGSPTTGDKTKLSATAGPTGIGKVLNFCPHKLGLQLTSFLRASYLVRARRIPTQRIPAPVPHARRR